MFFRSRKTRMKAALAVAGIAMAVLVAGCASTEPRKAGSGGTATALLKPTVGNAATGSVRFTQEGDGVLVLVAVHGLPPDTTHGMHLHQTGDCSAPDGMSAGGHFNPDGKPHGPQDGPHHAGDMPAIRADANGVASATFVLRGVSVSDGPHTIIGKALIVHAAADDYTTQPTGQSGARIACGVVMRR